MSCTGALTMRVAQKRTAQTYTKAHRFTIEDGEDAASARAVDDKTILCNALTTCFCAQCTLRHIVGWVCVCSLTFRPPYIHGIECIHIIYACAMHA